MIHRRVSFLKPFGHIRSILHYFTQIPVKIFVKEATFWSNLALCATCYKAKLRYFLEKIPCIGHPHVLFSFLLSPSFCLTLCLLLLCFPLVFLLLTVPSFVISCLPLCHGMCMNMSAICIFDASLLCVKVAYGWRFVIVTASLEYPLLVPWSTDGCIVEVWVCPSRVVVDLRPLCFLFVATRKMTTIVRCWIWLHGPLGVVFRKSPFA